MSTTATPSDPQFEKMLSTVMDIVCEVYALPPDKVTPKTHFVRDLGTDSLDFVTLILEIEEEYGVTIDDAIAFNSGVTVTQLTETVRALVP